MTVIAKITTKGRLTLPRAARLALNANTVEVEIQGETIILRPVKSVAGALAGYANGIEDFAAVRDKVWQEVALQGDGQ